jgi:phage regulator Rha-like protein
VPGRYLTITTIDREPRVLDTDLAERLGYAQPADIRKLIKRHEAALAALGLIATVAKSTGGRPATAYYLNKAQAIFVTTQSGTATAIDITVEVIKKFDAYEKGLVTAAPAMPAIPTTFAEALRLAAAEVERRALPGYTPQTIPRCASFHPLKVTPWPR